jgi:CO dehydrogenase/acetyl-CoA synthase beta subunit
MELKFLPENPPLKFWNRNEHEEKEEEEEEEEERRSRCMKECSLTSLRVNKKKKQINEIPLLSLSSVE